MADVTINNLTYSLPSSSAFIPFTDNGVTFKVSPSGLYAKPGNTLLVGGESLADLLPTTNTSLLALSTDSGIIRGGWLLCITERNTSWGDSAARIGVLRSGAGNGWWLSHNLDGSGAIHQSTQGDRLLITSEGYVKTPYQPGFKATITTQSQSTGQTVLWDTVEYAIPAGSFNTSTGEWTVPQTGRYLIIVNLLSQRNTTGGDWYVDLYVNSGQPYGGRMYTSKAGNSSVHAQLNASGIFYLNTGDKIKTVLTSQVGNVAPTIFHNLFCAELLG